MSEEISKNYLPFTIYQNIQKLLTYRKLVLHDESKKNGFLTQESFIKKIQYDGYILIECVDAPEKRRRIAYNIPLIKTFIIIFDLESSYLETPAEFVKLMNKIPSFTENYKFNMDIILVPYNPFSIHFTKKINSYITEETDKKGFIHIYVYDYSYFSSERPKHKFIPRHRICSIEEEKEILKSLFTKKIDLPKIRINDVMCVWLGAEIGDIIEILFPSECSGYEPKFMVVRI